MQQLHLSARQEALEGPLPEWVGLPLLQLPAVADDVVQVTAKGLGAEGYSGVRLCSAEQSERLVWGFHPITFSYNGGEKSSFRLGSFSCRSLFCILISRRRSLKSHFNHISIDFQSLTSDLFYNEYAIFSQNPKPYVVL